MKAQALSEIKKDLKLRGNAELLEICLKLARFKKENKELLTYLLFEADDEEGYRYNIKLEIDEQFSEINANSFYLIKKSVRKILRNVKKYIRFSKDKETEVELLLHFCNEVLQYSPRISHLTTMKNMLIRETARIEKKIESMHEDLQYDYQSTIKALKEKF